jgi:hypothetical protein
MSNTIRNTQFDNLVNYTTKKSSGDYSQSSHYNSVDPTSLSFYSKNNQIVESHLLNVSEKEFVEEVITEPNI